MDTVLYKKIKSMKQDIWSRAIDQAINQSAIDMAVVRLGGTGAYLLYLDPTLDPTVDWVSLKTCADIFDDADAMIAIEGSVVAEEAFYGVMGCS